MSSSHKQTVKVPHLGGITAAYQLVPKQYDASKPTLVLVNSFTTSSDLYRLQYQDEKLTSAVNLLAIELLGHGDTRGPEQFTYWDTAIMNLQVLDALGIKKAFVLGTSQGGWICTRMALLGGDRIEGIIPLGSSMDDESERSRKLGCWDGHAACGPSIKEFNVSGTTPNFELPTSFCDWLIEVGVGSTNPAAWPDFREFWTKEMKRNYSGDDGRRRARMCSINLKERDSLHARLFDVRCPVLWIHGTEDKVYSIANAKEEIKMFVNSPDAHLQIIEGGNHFLSATNPKEVDEALVTFIKKYHKA